MLTAPPANYETEEDKVPKLLPKDFEKDINAADKPSSNQVK